MLTASLQPGGGRGNRVEATIGAARGLTLIEILIVVAIIGTVAAIAVPMAAQSRQRAKVLQAIADVQSISTKLDLWKIYKGNLPETLAEANINMTDPWGRPYYYLRIEGEKGKGDVRKDRKLNPINSDYDLYSMGRDGVSKTQLSNKDSLDDIVRANNGGFVGLAGEY